MPETFEQWAAWGPAVAKGIRRIGINFGAPGDRMTRDGTLWLDFPSVGGPSPDMETRTHPDAPRYYYRHSVWIETGAGWPWVTASGVEGLTSFTLKNMKPGTFTVRLFFAERAGNAVGERIQNVSIEGRSVLRDFDITESAGGPLRGFVREFRDVAIDGEFTVELVAKRGETLVNGIELIRAKESSPATP
jgi:hypothetical protein